MREERLIGKNMSKSAMILKGKQVLWPDTSLGMALRIRPHRPVNQNVSGANLDG